jgi:hypothetical protein
MPYTIYRKAKDSLLKDHIPFKFDKCTTQKSYSMVICTLMLDVSKYEALQNYCCHSGVQQIRNKDL